MRSGPGTPYSVVLRLRTGVVLKVASTVESGGQTWYKISANEDFSALLSWRPELVVFGSGLSFRLPHPRLTRALPEAGIGFEAMDTRAACRTFNVLAAEGRRVLAAILIP